ncbi:phosphonoacetaldehyde reductase [Campylobacter insulaenigrae]|uniref:Phosphonoacetaldehyde reductase n=1 Tax=Campylobacter insulaenigrae TaxID=260714 RepID=A0ABY3G4A1_9BACT|nr:phosphonoacetaldehyde reductase [Campylobacter insulaenigrae]MCR6572171.1 phosphonoacetaldehyde reductase [Campylobacter insulaenigrae]MCR6580952.1 phosphonoacetaldehyde reductase [Campylobacter insulaenigrae]TWO26034.1 phosphonoacetaldehyde reductase [Campylobacter insulaenigrae]
MFYYNPVKINFDIDYIKVCELVQTNSILLVTSKSFYTNGVIDSITSKLSSKIKNVVYDIRSNPDINFTKSLKQNDDYEEIIALGGGSVLDTAKYLAVKGVINEDLKNNTLSPSNQAQFVPIYAIPTTSGTSSELTKWATLWDYKNNMKMSLMHEKLYSKHAIYDINLTLSLSRQLTIYTALDAFSHSIESIWNKNENYISTNYALQSMDLILHYLPKLVDDLQNTTYRKYITLASVYAGLAFSNTQTALAHALSYPITMKYGLAHGLACSFTIPILIECINDKHVSSILIPYKDKINSLFKKLNISNNLADYGINREFIDEIFLNLNSRAKNGVFDLDATKKKILYSL